MKFGECLSQWGGIGLPIVSLSGDISPVIFPYCVYSTISTVSESDKDFKIEILKTNMYYKFTQKFIREVVKKTQGSYGQPDCSMCENFRT